MRALKLPEGVALAGFPGQSLLIKGGTKEGAWRVPSISLVPEGLYWRNGGVSRAKESSKGEMMESNLGEGEKDGERQGGGCTAQVAAEVRRGGAGWLERKM